MAKKIESAPQTVGAQVSKLIEKEQEPVSLIDQQRAMQEEYLSNLAECVSTYSQKHQMRDFFVVVLTKHERALHNVFRNYFIARATCPAPNYDQAVYKYHHATGDLEFIWALPCREACLYLQDHAIEVHHEERQLLNLVLQFADGTLYRLCRQLNGEDQDNSVTIS